MTKRQILKSILSVFFGGVAAMNATRTTCVWDVANEDAQELYKTQAIDKQILLELYEFTSSKELHGRMKGK
jgi:hypothetical protein